MSQIDAAMKAKSESHSKKRKAFHAKYLAICKASIIQPLPEVKSKKKNLHVLDFHGDRIRYNDWLAVCGALKNDESLKFVAIRMRKNDEMVQEGIDNLKKTKSFKALPTIFTKFIFMELLTAIQGLLAHNNQLEVLILEGLPIYGRFMTHLVKGLISNRSIKILSLARSNLGDEACTTLCATIKHLRNIETVNLSQCNLGVMGATAIRDFVRFQKIHRYSEAWLLSLRYKDVDEDAIDGVRKISLNHNPQIGDEGLKIMTDELREDAWIKEVEMQNCGLSDAGGNHVIECYQLNKAITIDVRNNLEISNNLLRHILNYRGDSSSGFDSSESGETDGRKLTKLQIMEENEFIKNQLEAEIFRSQELEATNEELYRQIIEIKSEMELKFSSPQIPEGFVLIPKDELEKMASRKSLNVAYKSNSVVRLRRRKTTKYTLKKTQSVTIEDSVGNLEKSKSENVISVEVKPKKIFIEKNIGDSIEIGNGAELLSCFRKGNLHQVNEMGDGFDPRVFFHRSTSGFVVPSNSDVDSDDDE